MDIISEKQKNAAVNFASNAGGQAPTAQPGMQSKVQPPNKDFGTQNFNQLAQGAKGMRVGGAAPTQPQNNGVLGGFTTNPGPGAGLRPRFDAGMKQIAPMFRRGLTAMDSVTGGGGEQYQEPSGKTQTARGTLMDIDSKLRGTGSQYKEPTNVQTPMGTFRDARGPETLYGDDPSPVQTPGGMLKAIRGPEENYEPAYEKTSFNPMNAIRELDSRFGGGGQQYEEPTGQTQTFRGTLDDLDAKFGGGGEQYVEPGEESVTTGQDPTMGLRGTPMGDRDAAPTQLPDPVQDVATTPQERPEAVVQEMSPEDKAGFRKTTTDFISRKNAELTEQIGNEMQYNEEVARANRINGGGMRGGGSAKAGDYLNASTLRGDGMGVLAAINSATGMAKSDNRFRNRQTNDALNQQKVDNKSKQDAIGNNQKDRDFALDVKKYMSDDEVARDQLSLNALDVETRRKNANTAAEKNAIDREVSIATAFSKAAGNEMKFSSTATDPEGVMGTTQPAFKIDGALHRAFNSTQDSTAYANAVGQATRDLQDKYPNTPKVILQRKALEAIDNNPDWKDYVPTYKKQPGI